MAGPLPNQRRRPEIEEFTRRVDAERWLSAELVSLDRGEWVDPDHGRITWAEYSAQVMAGRVHLGARTVETYLACNVRAASVIGSVELSRITPELLRRLIADMAAHGYAPETTAKTMRWVRLTLNQAVNDRRILSSPARGIPTSHPTPVGHANSQPRPGRGAGRRPPRPLPVTPTGGRLYRTQMG